MADALSRLRAAMASRSPPIPFVGAGLSLAMSGGSPQASWHRFLLDGIELCEREVSPLPPGWAARMRGQLESADLFTYLSIADQIARRLRAFRGDIEFNRWIWQAAGVTHPTALGQQIIRTVRSLGEVIVTTNYDTLLEDLRPEWHSRTWEDLEHRAVFAESEVVIHLRGVVGNPGSLILGSADYDRLGEKLKRLKSSFFSRRFLFVGYGDNLSDPDAAPLIDFVNNLLPKESTEHYILVTGGQLRQSFERSLSPLISPVAYGDRLDDLIPFLRWLAAGEKIQVSQDPGSYEQRPRTAVPDLAGAAQEALRAALGVIQRALHALDRLEGRSAMPPGMQTWEFDDQYAVHEQLARSVRDPVAQLERYAAELETYSLEIIPAFAGVEREVERLTAERFARYAAGLVPVTDSVFELADLSGLLLRRLMLALDDLRVRSDLYVAGYRAHYESLDRAHRSIGYASGIAFSMRVRLEQLQGVRATGEAGSSRGAPRDPDMHAASSARDPIGMSDGDRMRRGFQAPPKYLGHVFISYVREDSLQVDRLEQVLKGAGVPVWRDKSDLWPGEDWRARIRHAITDDALVFLACFSRRSTTRRKSYQNEELLLAIEQLRLRPQDDPWLMPVRFDDCEVPDLSIGGGRSLAFLQRTDLFDDQFDEGADRLTAGILRVLWRQSGLF
jgi:TIR domain-containing protein/SIR2-like protein